MKKIEITNGSYGHKAAAGGSVRLLRTGETAEVQDAEAKRLVALGVAKIVQEAKTTPAGKGKQKGEADETPPNDAATK